jgi:hypothetical protein
MPYLNITHSTTKCSTLPPLIERFFPSIHRRISLRLRGYSRPPFMLILDRRNHCTDFLSLRCNKSDLLNDTNTVFSLWPDRLRWYFFFFAVFIIITLIFAAFVPSTSTSLSIMVFFICVSVLLFLNIIIPMIIFFVFRLPVLDDILIRSPLFMKSWFLDIPQVNLNHFPSGWLRRASYRLLLPFPPIREQWKSAVYWSPRGSPQESMLRAAIRDMFEASGTTGLSVWRDKGFLKWLWYWCAPIWGTYIVLWMLLALPVFFPVWYGKITLYMLAWAWMLFAAVFIWRESAELNRYAKVQNTDIRFMPPIFYENIKDISGVVVRLSDPHVLVVFNIVWLAGTGAYLSFVNVVLG